MLPTHSLVSAPGATPTRWMLFLHGIFGTGANWRTFARKWCAARPAWGAVLVDLRKHGGSQDAPPPHTLAACSADLSELDDAIAGPIRGVLGHSFGGKVALEYLTQRGDTLERAFVIDSTPGARPGARGSEHALTMLDVLGSIGSSFRSREEFVERVEGAGFTREIAQWQAMNLKRDGDLYVLRVDQPAIRALLSDYFARDLWAAVESPVGAARLHLVAGGRSEVFDAADRDRAARAAAASRGRVTFDVVPDAGHWVQVDAPDALLGLVVAHTA